MNYASTWNYLRTGMLRILDETSLWEKMAFPELNTFYLGDTPLYRNLSLDDIVQVNYSKSLLKESNNIDLMIFMCDVSQLRSSRLLYLDRSAPNGLPYASLGNSFVYDPVAIAAHIRFYLGLCIFAHYPERYNDYKQGYTLSFVLDKDAVPTKTKRVFCKKLLKALLDETTLEDFLGRKATIS